MAQERLGKLENRRRWCLATGSRLWVLLVIIWGALVGAASILSLVTHAGGDIPSLPGAAAELTIISPKSGDVVGAVIELQIRANEVTEDIHILAMDTANPGLYRYAGRIALPPTGRTQLLTRLLDTTGFETAGTFRLIVISTNRFSTPAGGVVDESAIPSSVPHDGIELRHAAAIISPARNAQVAAEETVQAQGFLIDSYMAAVLRPANEGGYWVQNDGILASPAIPIPIRVQFGGRSAYHLYIGVTYDQELFRRGDRYDHLPTTDRAGKPVYWIGPVEVTHY